MTEHLPDYFELLGVTRASTLEQVREPYRRAAAYWHTDHNGTPKGRR